MENLFLQILNMSITATWIVLAVCVLRLILKKAPKWVNVALWGLVAFRLVCPFSFESVLSLLPSAQTVPTDITMTAEPVIHSGIPALNSAVNPVIQNAFAPNPGDSANPLQVVTFVAATLWIVGMVGMLLYATVSFLRLHKKTKESVVLQGNVYLCDRIDTPFILGLFRPRIYLPSSMEESDVNHVLAHENAHLARRDHWWKPLGFLLLTVHWFNPVLWLAYVLLCRDIELACDEKVIRNMDVQNKKDYSSALINCSVSRKNIAACPLAFGEVGVKNRIKTVLHYKKPTLWILIAAVLVSCIAAVCLLTNPVSKDLGGYEYRVQRYYYDNVIGEDRANRELGEYTYEIDENLSTVRYINGNFHCHYTLVPVADGTEKLIAAVESTLPAYYKLLNARQVYFREGWDSALREQSELNYFIIQYSDGSLIGGYIGVYDEVPGQIYKLQRTGKIADGKMRSTEEIEEWFDFTDNDIVAWGSVLRYDHPVFSDTVFEWKEGQIYAVRNGEEALLISGMPVKNCFFSDLTGDGAPELCASVVFGSGMVDMYIAVYDFAERCKYVLWDRGHFEYWLSYENGQLVANRSKYPKESATEIEKGTVVFLKEASENNLIFEGTETNIRPSVQGEQLTLQDVVRLSQKGDALTWSDFENYVYVETGSGLYIRVYEIDEMFTLWIGGGSMDDTIKPMYIYLTAADSSEPSRIDIREADVQAFIDEHKNNPVVKNVTDFTWNVCDVVADENTFAAFCSQFGMPEKMYMSSKKYLPFAKIESVGQLQDFKAVMQPYMRFETATLSNYSIFKMMESMFDDRFFEENILLLFYADCDCVESHFTMRECTVSQGVLSIAFEERVPAWCNPARNGFLFCVMLARTQAEKVSSYSATISAVYENQNKTQLPTETLLTEDMEWVFSHSGYIGEEDEKKMQEISIDRTQGNHPLVQITSEDELNSFVQYMGNEIALTVENLNVDADGNKRFNKSFFEKNDLVLVYLETGNLETEYSFVGYAQNGTSLSLYFISTSSQFVSLAMSGWLLSLVVPKSITQNVTDVACVVQNFKGYIEGSVKDFESLISGISTLKDVQSFAPNGEYLFLESGRGEPRVSTHFTADNYVVSVEYDENNIVKKVTKRVY